MDNWIALVKANMKDRKVTQDELAQRLGMSQGGIGHWLNKRRVPSLADMNRVLAELGLGYLEVALEIRERAAQVPEREAHYNPYFRYPVSDWKQACELREERAPYSLVDPAIGPEPGRLVVAQWAGTPQATFRRLQEESGQHYLVPLNPTYPKVLLTDGCRLLGVVVQATAKF